MGEVDGVEFGVGVKGLRFGVWGVRILGIRVDGFWVSGFGFSFGFWGELWVSALGFSFGFRFEIRV